LWHAYPTSAEAVLPGRSGEPWRAGRAEGLAIRGWRAHYTWDSLHGEIEVFDALGYHLGAADAVTGDMIKEAVAGRKTDDGTRIAGRVKVGRNDACPCGSGKKWKKCCGGLGRVH
jgi:hypothetical protein